MAGCYSSENLAAQGGLIPGEQRTGYTSQTPVAVTIEEIGLTSAPLGYRLKTAAQAGHFLVTAEVMPPKGGDPSHMVEMARLLKGHVHAVNVTDGSRAVMRMSSLAASVILQQQGIEAIFQVACRDRNRIALQADLLGAQALGLRNILALTGDPVKAGDHPEARPVFDLESVRLLRLIQQLNQGQDSHGKPLTDGALSLFPGAAIDPQSPSWSGLQRRFEAKVKAGACFFQSQLITDFDRLSKFMDQVAVGTGRPVLAGIFLLKSAKNAQFINRNVPGAQIPQAIIDRLAQAPDPLQEGIKIAAEQVQAARHICQGVHLMAVRREDLIPQILELGGLKTLEPDPNQRPVLGSSTLDAKLSTNLTKNGKGSGLEMSAPLS